jgi:multidrug resistance efflux pump
MSDVRAESQPEAIPADLGIGWIPEPTRPAPRRRGRHLLALLTTMGMVALACVLGWKMWQTYMEQPWTRDGRVRAYIVTMAPEVSGHIVALSVADNQFVHKGDLLMVVEPTDYQIALRLNEAAVQQAQATLRNAEREANRRQALSHGAISVEEQQTYETRMIAARAQLQQALANLDQSRVNLRRTDLRSPVNGWVTNLLAQLGDYAHVGQNEISVVNADSFWVDGYFEETNIQQIRLGDPAQIKLMGSSQIIIGHVSGIARGINVKNADPNGEGIADVDPIFTWVRLAQRIPVRIHIDKVPKGIILAAGMTATVQIDPRQEPLGNKSANNPASRDRP